ncbi:MAG: DUF4838 domain-containing protein [Planctomycetes bacterium]|nr:DUF4838 domain-containing protein [Planctomycetota bacterium]
MNRSHADRLTVLFLFASVAAAGDVLTIVENGQARAKVLVRADAGKWESEAAKDIVGTVRKMSGAELPLVNTAEGIQAALAAGEPLIIVGGLALAQRPELARELERLAKPKPVLRADAVVARREGRRIYLAGLNDDCHYYAAIELLEGWGCRWLLPTAFGECVPERKTLVVDDLNVAYAPPFEVRKYWISWIGSYEGRAEFMRRNRMNELGVPAGHALGDYVKELIPQGKGVTSVCLASEATAEHVAKKVIARFEKGDQAVSLGMEDGIYESGCPEDEALKGGLWDKYFLVPSLTDSFLTFYNNVARRTKEKFPDRKIGFLAYSNITLPPQREMTAETPLVAYLAPIDICPIHGMDDPRCESRQEYGSMMYRWSQVMAGRVIIYDYDQGMLVWRDLPNPSVQSFRQDVQHYRKAGILGVDTESRGAMATIFLNLYLRARLLWNPETDVGALLADAYGVFFGPAAEPMGRYWNAIQKAWESSEVHEHEFMLAPMIYAPELLEGLRVEVEAAERLVASLPAESAYAQRVRFVRLGFDVLQHYLAMVRAAAGQGDYPAAVSEGEKGLAAREQLTQMNPTFTTTRLENGTAWWPGEVKQYRELAEITEGPKGTRLQLLPLEWSFRTDPSDTGVARHWANPGLNDAGWRKLRTDLYMEAQGVMNPDHSDYNGYVWYRTAVEIAAPDAGKKVHLRFPGLFGEAWLYVNGYLAGYRPWKPMWWVNDYRFEWDVDLSGKLRAGRNVLALRVLNRHHWGGLWRRAFLYEERTTLSATDGIP